MSNNIVSGLLFAFTLTLSAAEPVTFLVTVNGGKYYIDGSLTPDLVLNPGVTYQFVQSDASNSTHPLRLSSTLDGVHAAGDQYLPGYSYQGTAGVDGVATFTVPSEAPSRLYYYCPNHSGMANIASIATNNLIVTAGEVATYTGSTWWIDKADADPQEKLYIGADIVSCCLAC